MIHLVLQTLKCSKADHVKRTVRQLQVASLPRRELASTSWLTTPSSPGRWLLIFLVTDAVSTFETLENFYWITGAALHNTDIFMIKVS